MPLHPEVQAVIDATAVAGGLVPQTLSATEMRASFAANWQPSPNLRPVGSVEDTATDGRVPVRVYRPQGDGPFPVLVWFHGGGWVIGSLDENEATCRVLCASVGAVVVSVDYRLAPEHRFPAAAEDAYAALVWAAGLDGVDGSRVAVAGESAGGNLAAVASLISRDRGGPAIALQVLAAPVTAPPGDRPSYVDFATGHFLDRASMEWFFEQYPAAPADLESPYLSPLLAPDLSGLPPALVMTAEFDVLRDEGEQYAHRLLDAGVPVELVRYDGQIHGFFALLVDQLSISSTAHERAAAALRRAFAGKATA
ncbi:putative lipase [Alloactinosynnema sp. L-07]|uniref:alpha/beta hydrolase n=1 Tax=Alloactinosynnema sp. L-07 TaxID=1653480 RepID=UPI00065F0360|nr:alpha/beta hydrolase [Alloactinosynnema sp. L-07]CRK57845.1 putative lipase [Alloactinosynnema sp. L-07]